MYLLYNYNKFIIVLLLNYCLANVKVNEACESDTQCTGTDNSRNCSGGICVCQVGYVSINNTCHQGNIKKIMQNMINTFRQFNFETKNK